MSAIVLIAALIAGKIALSALSIGEIATLAQAGITVARLGVMLGAKLEQRLPPRTVRHNKVVAGRIVAFHEGGPIGWGRAPITFRWEPYNDGTD